MGTQPGLRLAAVRPGDRAQGATRDIDLDTVGGVERAMELAVNARDAAMFEKLRVLRAGMLPGAGSRSALSERLDRALAMVADLKATVSRAVAARRRGRPGATYRGDMAAIRAVLANTPERRGPARQRVYLGTYPCDHVRAGQDRWGEIVDDPWGEDEDDFEFIEVD